MKRLFTKWQTSITLALLIATATFQTNLSFAQNCTVNAGGSTVICGSTTTLNGTVSGTPGTGSPTWAFVSGPTTPAIVAPNNLTTDITGMISDGDYVFSLTNNCGTGVSTDNVTITAHPRPVSFTAGPDVTNICASVGTTPLAGVIPPGFTGEWRAVNIYYKVRNGVSVATNSTFSNTTSAMPDFSLINKSNHEIDPYYQVILTITSLDGLCSYEDEAFVKFCPNPQISPYLTTTECLAPAQDPRVVLNSAPFFSTAFNSSGTVDNGTTVTLNVVSQPVGGNISFDYLDNNALYFNGVTVPGAYVFTLTVTNCCGSYTTPGITYNFTGTAVSNVNFQPAGHTDPEQLTAYASGGSGGEVHCDIVGTSAPENFYFDINAVDPPGTLSTVTPTGIFPGNAAPAVVVTGAGTMNRMATVTPPAGGWKIGTYAFNVNTTASDGGCGKRQIYYIHVSDHSREAVAVADIATCYAGTGAVSVTVPLPAVYKGVPDPSYFQDLNGFYDISVVSQPAGSGTPAFETQNLRDFTDASTVISNLTTPGDYVFQIAANSGNGVGPFLQQEYACSGKASTAQFTVHVESLINANAGSDQTSTCAASVSLAGNNPGAGTGAWTIVSSPAGSTPVLTSTSSANTTATGVNVAGTYIFKWTITSLSGGCTSSDNVSYTVTSTPTLGTTQQPTCSVTTGTINLTNLPGGTWTINHTGTSSATISGTGSTYADAGLAPGNYSYTITSADGCTSDPSAPITLTADTNCTPPVANPVDFHLPTQPTTDIILTLNGGSNPTAPNGSDTEDGALGGTTLTSTIVITQLPSHGLLSYNGSPVVAGVAIPNFDASLLTIQLTGSGYTSTTFEYGFIDNSGLQSSNAPYTISWNLPLPVTLTSFSADKEGSMVQLKWSTTAETNAGRFDIQRSDDVKTWITIGAKVAAGNSKTLLTYNFDDVTPLKGSNYYRLKMIDKDATFAYSQIQSVEVDGMAKSVLLYPNPVSSTLYLKGINLAQVKTVEILSTNGISAYKSTHISATGINVGNLPNGIHIVKITRIDGTFDINKIVIEK